METLTKEQMKQVVELVLKPCIGRNDAYARRSPDGNYFKVDEPITDELLHRHLDPDGDFVMGAYIMEVGTTTKLAVLDLDDHDHSQKQEEIDILMAELCRLLKHRGLYPLPIISGGGNGRHIWIKWETPQDARSVRYLLTTIIAELGLEVGTGGLSKGEIEIFPKQDEVGKGEYGSLVALPFARKSKPLDEHTQKIIGLKEIL